MTTVITATFDGEVLRPDNPTALEPHRRYSLVVHSLPDNDTPSTESAWDVLNDLSGKVVAPEDWSEEHDHYLYGTPKKASD